MDYAPNTNMYLFIYFILFHLLLVLFLWIYVYAIFSCDRRSHFMTINLVVCCHIDV